MLASITIPSVTTLKDSESTGQIKPHTFMAIKLTGPQIVFAARRVDATCFSVPDLSLYGTVSFIYLLPLVKELKR